MQRAIIQALFTLILAGGCWVLALSEAQAQGEPAHDDGFVTLPFKVQWGEGSHIVVPFNDPLVPESFDTSACPTGPGGFPNGGGVVITSGYGEASHLGRLSNAGARCAVQFFPPTDPPFVNFNLRATLTAANGDRIFGSMEYAPTPFTPADVESKVLEITGGTGRFEDASGWLMTSQESEISCTDDSGLCLAGTWSGGSGEGQLIIRKP